MLIHRPPTIRVAGTEDYRCDCDALRGLPDELTDINFADSEETNAQSVAPRSLPGCAHRSPGRGHPADGAEMRRRTRRGRPSSGTSGGLFTNITNGPELSFLKENP